MKDPEIGSFLFWGMEREMVEPKEVKTDLMGQHSVSTAASLSRRVNRGWRQAACLAPS